jgi:hypothetical protein
VNTIVAVQRATDHSDDVAGPIVAIIVIGIIFAIITHKDNK